MAYNSPAYLTGRNCVMDDSKLNELRTLHRELAEYLANQSEVVITLRKTVAAIQQTLDNDSAPQGGYSALSKCYKEHLASLAPTASPRPNLTEVLSREAVNSLVRKLNEW
jgi:hypothetical protein